MIGKNLENILQKANIKQKELAKRINLTPAAINNYIKEKTEPNLKILIDIAKELNITTDELLGIEKKSELPEHTKLIKKLNKLSEIECHKLNVFADGLISNRPEEQKEKTYTIIREIENEELNEMYNQLDFGEQNQVLGYIKEKIKLKKEDKNKN